MVFIIYNAKDWSAQNGKYYTWALPACVSTVSLPYVTHMIRSLGLPPPYLCNLCTARLEVGVAWNKATRVVGSSVPYITLHCTIECQQIRYQ